MKYKIKSDVGRYNKGSIVDVENITFNEIDVSSNIYVVMWFFIDGKKYGSSLIKTDDIEQKLIDRCFDEL